MQTDISTLEALLDRVEKAEGLGGAERYRLDLAIYDALRLSGQVDCYTASIDAVIALVQQVLPEHFWHLGPLEGEESAHEHHEFGCLLGRYLHVADKEDAIGYGATPPLAILSALLRALIAQSKEQADG